MIRGNMLHIYNLFYQLVVNVGKYLPQKGKVRENNECLMTLVIFTDLSLFRQIFPHINKTLMLYTVFLDVFTPGVNHGRMIQTLVVLANEPKISLLRTCNLI